MELGVSVLLRPQVKRNRGKFVDKGLGKAVFGEVDGLDVGAAGIAALDTDVGEFGGGVDGELGVVVLAASGTNEAAELPFDEAETAEQAAAASIALLPKNPERGLAIAERAKERGVAAQLQIGLRAGEFGVGLKKLEHKEFLRIGGGVDVGPDFGKEPRPGMRVGVTQIMCDLRERGGSFFFDDREEWLEAADEFSPIWIGWRD